MYVWLHVAIHVHSFNKLLLVKTISFFNEKIASKYHPREKEKKTKHTLRVLLLFQASTEFCQLSVPKTLKVVTEEQG